MPAAGPSRGWQIPTLANNLPDTSLSRSYLPRLDLQLRFLRLPPAHNLAWPGDGPWHSRLGSLRNAGGRDPPRSMCPGPCGIGRSEHSDRNGLQRDEMANATARIDAGSNYGHGGEVKPPASRRLGGAQEAGQAGRTYLSKSSTIGTPSTTSSHHANASGPTSLTFFLISTTVTDTSPR